MKVTKVIRNKDYVRFGFEIEMESEGLSVTSNVTGGLSTVTVLDVDIHLIEDPDFEYEFSIFGEKVNYQGFKEIYSKLFNKKWDDFIEELDKLSHKEITNHFPKSIDNLSIEDRLMYLDSVVNGCPKVIGKDGLVYITESWLVHTLLYSLKAPNKVISSGFTQKDGKNAYGMNLNNVTENIEYIETKLIIK